jgi:hypothetical protein
MEAPGPEIARPRPPARRALGPALAAALVALHAGLALQQATVQSATYDEPYYATAGWARLVAGKVGLNPEHPPAVKLWLGASWLGAAGLPAPAEIPGFAAADQWTFGPRALYRDPARAPWLLFRARASVVLLSVLLAVGVWLAARRAFGGPAGLLALALYALDPLVVANAGLATLDLGASAAIFAAVTLSWVALDGGRAATVAAAGVATGLALASKGTGVVVLPVLALLAVAPAARRGAAAGGVLRARALRALAVGAVGAVALALACLPEGPAGWWRALVLQREHALATGHATWAMGLQTMNCWAWWFPFAWLVKTPLALLVATGAGAALVAWRARQSPEAAVAILATPALLLAASMSAGICNGVRQLLPAVPFLAVAGGGALAVLSRNLPGRLAAGALLASMAVALVRVHPDAITYSNEVAGGPSRTWRLLTDSNVDWGQSLPGLADALRDVPVRRLWLDYVGTAWPPAHGVPRFRKVQDWRFRAGAVLPVPRQDGPDAEGRELLAVSATCLVDAYVAETDLHAWLRERKPWRWAGNAIAVYDLTGDAEAYRSLARMAERMRDPVTAAEAAARAREIEAGAR